ncbi:MAG: hypothetical protein AB1898_14170 [Acidobacteriota bacterium]
MGAVVVVAVTLRLGSALYHGNAVTALPGIWDQISYDGLAQRVVDGHGFSFGEGHWPATQAGEPTAHWSYLYTLYLVAIYSVFGHQPLIARLIQAVVSGFLHTWLVWRLGRRVFGVQTGLAAASLSAVYLYFVYYAGGLLTETFYFLGVLWVFDAALRLADKNTRIKDESSRQKRGWLPWVELGLAIGTTVLLRQVFVLFVPFVYIWLWWSACSCARVKRNLEQYGFRRLLPRGHLKGFMASGLIVVFLVGPWTLRNYRSFGTFVLVNTNAGFAFYWGNHPIHGRQFMALLPPDRGSYSELIPEQFRSLNEAEMDRALLKEALHNIAKDPVRYFLLSLSRASEYFKFWPSEQSSRASNLARVASFGILLPLMLLGLCTCAGWIRKPQHPGQRSQIILLLLFISAYSVIHLLTWTLIRYRLPVDVVLILFAGLGATVSLRQYSSLRMSRRFHRIYNVKFFVTSLMHRQLK